jgi:hypothetical protein
MDADPFFVGEGDFAAAKALAGESTDGRLFLYPGDAHLFSDRSLAAFDPAAAAVLERRLLDFLASIAVRPPRRGCLCLNSNRRLMH